MKARILKRINRFKKLFFLVAFLFANKALADTINIPNPLGTDSFYDLLDSITTAVIYLSAPIAIGAIVYSGYLYISSGGEEKELEKAKKVITWTIVGFIIILSAKGLILAIKSLFGVK